MHRLRMHEKTRVRRNTYRWARGFCVRIMRSCMRYGAQTAGARYANARMAKHAQRNCARHVIHMRICVSMPKRMLKAMAVSDLLPDAKAHAQRDAYLQPVARCQCLSAYSRQGLPATYWLMPLPKCMLNAMPVSDLLPDANA